MEQSETQEARWERINAQLSDNKHPPKPPEVPAPAPGGSRPGSGRPKYEREIIGRQVYVVRPDGTKVPEHAAPKPKPVAPVVRSPELIVLSLTQKTSARADVELARNGDFDAYWRRCAWLPNRPEMMRRDDLQEQIIKCHAADLICQGCGKYHCQDPLRKMVGADGQACITPVRCPHCGMDDCAGPLWHNDTSGMGGGKTQTLLGVLIPFRLGRISLTGNKPRAFILGSSHDKATERLAIMDFAMSHDNFREIFGDTLMPRVARNRRNITCIGYDKKWGVVEAETVRKFKSGEYPDIIVLDDICNTDTEVWRPADGRAIKQKVTTNIFQGKPIDLVLDIVGNTYIDGDTNDWMYREARAHPSRWSCLQFKATWRKGVKDAITGEWTESDAPGAVEMDGEDGRPIKAESYWPAGVPDWMINEAYERNPIAARASYFCLPLQAGDLAIKDIRFWVSGRPEDYDAVYREILKDITMLTADQLRELAYLHSMDLAYTGQEALQKKGRSQTSKWTMGRNAESGLCFAVYAKTEWITAGKHLDHAERMEAQNPSGRQIAFETMGGQKETLERFREAKWTVTDYKPVGDKQQRKSGIAQEINNGTILLRGIPAIVEGLPAIAPHPSQEEVYHDLKVWPLRRRNTGSPLDTMDGLEIVCRKLWERFGLKGTKRRDEQKPRKRTLMDDVLDDEGEDKPKQSADAELISVGIDGPLIDFANGSGLL